MVELVGWAAEQLLWVVTNQFCDSEKFKKACGEEKPYECGQGLKELNPQGKANAHIQIKTLQASWSHHSCMQKTHGGQPAAVACPTSTLPALPEVMFGEGGKAAPQRTPIPSPTIHICPVSNTMLSPPPPSFCRWENRDPRIVDNLPMSTRVQDRAGMKTRASWLLGQTYSRRGGYKWKVKTTWPQVGNSREVTLACVWTQSEAAPGAGRTPAVLAAYSSGCFSSCPAQWPHIPLGHGPAFHGFFYLSLPISWNGRRAGDTERKEYRITAIETCLLITFSNKRAALTGPGMAVLTVPRFPL